MNKMERVAIIFGTVASVRERVAIIFGTVAYSWFVVNYGLDFLFFFLSFIDLFFLAVPCGM